MSLLNNLEKLLHLTHAASQPIPTHAPVADPNFRPSGQPETQAQARVWLANQSHLPNRPNMVNYGSAVAPIAYRQPIPPNLSMNQADPLARFDPQHQGPYQYDPRYLGPSY